MSSCRSTRELARRFKVHPNTISAAYRQLQRDRWVELRHGSGVYVRLSKPQAPLPAMLALDQLIANLLHSAHQLGADLPAVRARVAAVAAVAASRPFSADRAG